MSKVSLPPPPGFRRVREKKRSEASYVYPFAESAEGDRAAEIHSLYVTEDDARWRQSKLRRLALKEGLRQYKKELRHLRGSAYLPARREIYARARTIGMLYLSLRYPLFVRRDPLQQVLEHLVRESRYYMRLDIKDAFGSVYPGCHTSMPVVRKVQWTTDDLFSQREEVWDGWPFFHRGTGGLIRGAPASPIIFNQYCAQSGFDAMLRSYAQANCCVVTRYADDVVFSSFRPFGTGTFRTMRRRFGHFGFELNEAKSGRFDTERHPIEFLGVSLYRGKVRPRPAFFERLDSIESLTEGRLGWLERVENLNVEMKQFRRKLYCG